jgi:8-oxo-dGTP pyrophosphatase MutT (NUDIX family)
MTDFVNIIAVDPAGRNVVLLTKSKGPEHLLGKLTFPGGKDDMGDASPGLAAARELLEEAGVDSGNAEVIMVYSKVTKFGPLKTFFVACDISMARTMEAETISIGDIDAALTAARDPATANRFTDDFLELFEPALPLIRHLRAVSAADVAPDMQVPSTRRARP